MSIYHPDVYMISEENFEKEKLVGGANFFYDELISIFIHVAEY